MSFSARMYQTLVLRMSLTLQCLFAVSHDSMNQEFHICGKLPKAVKCNIIFLRKMLCLTLCLTFLHNMNLRYSNSDVPCKKNRVFIGSNTEDFLLQSSQEPLQFMKTLAQTNVHASASYKFQTNAEIICCHS
jgi:hypothetical protein